jgi:hypothetical protein
MPRHSPSATKAEKLIVLTDDTVPPVILIDDTLPPVDLDAGDIAQTLGADHTKPAPKGGSPITWYAVREEAARRLRSTGGRPGLPGGDLRKVAVTDEDWRMVRELADSIAEPGFRPSVGQVAGVLLSRALHEAHRSLPKEAKAHAFDSRLHTKS